MVGNTEIKCLGCGFTHTPAQRMPYKVEMYCFLIYNVKNAVKLGQKWEVVSVSQG